MIELLRVASLGIIFLLLNIFLILLVIARRLDRIATALERKNQQPPVRGNEGRRE